MRQVIHALLTRPPLSHNRFLPEGIPWRCFVRLACVKHAASVHPEPGSNSQLRFVPGSFWLILLTFVFTALGCRTFFSAMQSFYSAVLWISLRIFQGYFTVQLSKFFLFRCCSATFIDYHIFAALSTTFYFYFFAFFASLMWSLFIIPSAFLFVNILFSFFSVCAANIQTSRVLHVCGAFVPAFHLPYLLFIQIAAHSSPCTVQCYIRSGF